MKNFLTVLLMMVAVGFAQSKAEFSIVIRPTESTVKAGSGVVVEVRKTNLTDHVLLIGGGINPDGDYAYDVRRDGVLVPETEEARNENARRMKEPRSYEGGSLIDSSVPPHRTATQTIGVSRYRDMIQPGKYTIQLQQGKVKSNIVTVTVIPQF